MKYYNNRTNNNKSLHPCDHSITARKEKKPSDNDKYFAHILHAEGRPCGSASIGYVGTEVNCNKCLALSK